MKPNPAASVDAPIAFLFTIVRQWRRTTEQQAIAHDEVLDMPLIHMLPQKDHP